MSLRSPGAVAQATLIVNDDERVATHGMHHRAQCLNMLRQLAAPGVSDRLPEIDVLDWAATRARPGHAEPMIASTSTSILMRGSASPASIMVAAGRISPNAARSTGHVAGKSAAHGRM